MENNGYFRLWTGISIGGWKRVFTTSGDDSIRRHIDILILEILIYPDIPLNILYYLVPACPNAAN